MHFTSKYHKISKKLLINMIYYTAVLQATFMLCYYIMFCQYKRAVKEEHSTCSAILMKNVNNYFLFCFCCKKSSCHFQGCFEHQYLGIIKPQLENKGPFKTYCAFRVNKSNRVGETCKPFLSIQYTNMV